MDQGPLVREKIEAGADFLRRFESYAHVQAAFWLKPSERGNWKLYLWSDQFTDRNFDAAYGEVLRLAREIKNPNFDPFEVKILRGPNPLAQAAINVYQPDTLRVPTHYTSREFGGLSVDGVYIYPPAAAVAAS